MEPIRETQQVLADLAVHGDDRTGAQLAELGRLVLDIVPACTGLSVSLVEEGLTFTLAASSEDVAVIDAVQYLDGGPCIDAVDRDEVILTGGTAALDETRWRLLAQATAAVGVRSTLSIPIRQDGRVVGGINLYASRTDAFEGHLDALTGLVGAAAYEAITNADLGFTTRDRARLAPAHLEELDTVNQAVGFVAAAQRLDAQAARALLQDAAARAGLSESQVARALVAFLGG